MTAAGVTAADAAEEKLFETKRGRGTRCQEAKHSLGENVRIVRLAALVSCRGHRRRCCEIEAVQDKDGEETKCQERKHYVGENVIIL